MALAFALATTAAQAEIIQIITEDGEMRYIDTNAGTMVDNAAPGTVSGPRESHLADSTIGFATRPEVAPNPTPSNPDPNPGGGYLCWRDGHGARQDICR